MKKKIGIALALLLVLVMTLSVTAHAMEPSQAITGSRDGGTAISITDITPREGENKEDSENDTKNYTVSSYYPVSVQTAEEGGVQLLVKTFLVPPNTAPTELIEKDLTRRGVAYEAIDIIKEAGGMAVLAHPLKTKKIGDSSSEVFWKNLDLIVADLKKHGLKGMECYHPSASHEQALKLVVMAGQYHLHITEGSDFHGDEE